jgi:hypothetical protein
MTCQEYVKDALKEINGENDFKNSVIHCLEFMAEKIDNPKYVPPPVMKAGEHTAEGEQPDTLTNDTQAT